MGKSNKCEPKKKNILLTVIRSFFNSVGKSEKFVIFLWYHDEKYVPSKQGFHLTKLSFNKYTLIS